MKVFGADKNRISGECGKALIGRIPITGGIEGKDLPKVLRRAAGSRQGGGKAPNGTTSTTKIMILVVALTLALTVLTRVVAQVWCEPAKPLLSRRPA